MRRATVLAFPFLLLALASLLSFSSATTCRAEASASSSQVTCVDELSGLNQTFFSIPVGSTSSCLKTDASTSIVCFGFAHGSATSMGCLNLTGQTYFHNYSIVPGAQVGCGLSPNGNTVCYAIETMPSAANTASIYKICTKTSNGEFIFHDDRGSPDDGYYNQPLANIQGSTLTVWVTDASQCFSLAAPNYNGYGYQCFKGSSGNQDALFYSNLFQGAPSDFFQSSDLYTYAALYASQGGYCSGDSVTLRLPPWQGRGVHCGPQGTPTDVKLAYNLGNERVFCFAIASSTSEYGCAFKETQPYQVLTGNLNGFNVTDLKINPTQDVACAVFGGALSAQLLCANLTDSNASLWSTYFTHNLTSSASKVQVSISSTQSLVCYATSSQSFVSLTCLGLGFGELVLNASQSLSTSDLALTFNSRGDIICASYQASSSLTTLCYQVNTTGSTLLWTDIIPSLTTSLPSVASSIDFFPANRIKRSYAKLISNSILRIPSSFSVTTASFTISNKANVTVDGDFIVPTGSPTDLTQIVISASVLNITRSLVVNPNVVISITKPEAEILISGNVSIPVGSTLNYTYSPNAPINGVSRAPLTTQGCADLMGSLTVHVDSLPNKTSVEIIDGGFCGTQPKPESVQVTYDNDPCYKVSNVRAQVTNNTFGAVWNADFICSAPSRGLYEALTLLSITCLALYLL